MNRLPSIGAAECATARMNLVLKARIEFRFRRISAVLRATAHKVTRTRKARSPGGRGERAFRDLTPEGMTAVASKR